MRLAAEAVGSHENAFQDHFDGSIEQTVTLVKNAGFRRRRFQGPRGLRPQAVCVEDQEYFRIEGVQGVLG